MEKRVFLIGSRINGDGVHDLANLGPVGELLAELECGDLPTCDRMDVDRDDRIDLDDFADVARRWLVEELSE